MKKECLKYLITIIRLQTSPFQVTRTSPKMVRKEKLSDRKKKQQVDKVIDFSKGRRLFCLVLLYQR